MFSLAVGSFRFFLMAIWQLLRFQSFPQTKIILLFKIIFQIIDTDWPRQVSMCFTRMHLFYHISPGEGIVKSEELTVSGSTFYVCTDLCFAFSFTFPFDEKMRETEKQKKQKISSTCRWESWGMRHSTQMISCWACCVPDTAEFLVWLITLYSRYAYALWTELYTAPPPKKKDMLKP